MISGLNFVLIHVSSVTNVLPFYTEKLHLEVESQGPDFVQFKQPGGQGAIFALSADGLNDPIANAELWWYVDNAEATLADLQQQDVTIVDPLTDMPFGRTFTIQDPEGHKMYMLQSAR